MQYRNELALCTNYEDMKKVAVMVGCLNANSFIRMFKRVEGITPGQYVENLKK